MVKIQTNADISRSVRIEYSLFGDAKIQRRTEDGCFVLTGFDTNEGVDAIKDLKDLRDLLDAAIKDFENGWWCKECFIPEK